MSKKVLVISASYRTPSNSDQLADAFIEGVTAAGGSTVKLNLRDRVIKPCLGCDCCYAVGAPCVQRDFMAEIYPELERAELVAFATPLYYFTFPGQLKLVIDRFYALYRNGYPVRESVLLVTAADTAGHTFEPIRLTYNAIMDHLKWRIRGMVLAGGLGLPDEIGRTEFPSLARELGRQVGA